MAIIEQLIGALQKPVFTERADGREGRLMPPGWVEYHDADSVVKAPAYVFARRRLETIDDLAMYVEMHAEEGNSVVYWLNRDACKIAAVMDPIGPEVPSFERNSATVEYVRSPEYTRWVAASGEWMTPKRFAEFLEDNVDSIVGEFAGGKVLGMARSLNVKVSGEVNADVDVSEGERKLSLTTDSKVLGAGIPFPEFLAVKLRVFKGTDPVEFSARLRCDVTTQGLSFQIKLPDDSEVVEKSFEILLDSLKSKYKDCDHAFFYHGSPTSNDRF